MFLNTGSRPGPKSLAVEFFESCGSYVGLPEVRDRTNFIDFRFVQNDYSVQIESWIYQGNSAVTSSLKKIVLGGLITGFGTGLVWSVIVYVFSYDQVFNGREFALSLILPLLVALAAWKRVGVQRKVLLPIAYLTLFIPLLGIGAGGANILQMTIAGAFGGVFWASPFVLYTLVKRYLYR